MPASTSLPKMLLVLIAAVTIGCGPERSAAGAALNAADRPLVLADSTTYSIDVLGPDGAVQSTLARPAEPITGPMTSASARRPGAALPSRTR